MTAKTPEGEIRVLRFKVMTTIDDAIVESEEGGKGSEEMIEGAYEKVIRWNFSEGGQSFKFEIGSENEGVISGIVESCLLDRRSPPDTPEAASGGWLGYSVAQNAKPIPA